MSAGTNPQTVRVHGRELKPGNEVSIAGERGRCRFMRATTTSDDRIVFDFIGGAASHECWCSFYPERGVKTAAVHRITRTRQIVTVTNPGSRHQAAIKGEPNPARKNTNAQYERAHSPGNLAKD